jgi:hypothetical protein
MAKNITICVGTLGMGLWRSTDGGKSWARGKLWKGYQGGRSVFGLAVHPQDPRIIYAGADDGIYRSEDRAARRSSTLNRRWTRIAFGALPSTRWTPIQCSLAPLYQRSFVRATAVFTGKNSQRNSPRSA